nr:hypothetical protein [Tanacetum cinerariifolium]
MGESLSPNPVFDFPMDKPEPQDAYDFFAPGSLPGYAGNPNNTNRWIKADVPFLRKLGDMGEPLGAEVDEPLVDPVIDELAEPIVEVEEQMVAPVMDMEEDLAMLFGVEDDSSDDDLKGPEGDEEKVIMVGDAEVADSIAIREIGPRISTVEGQMQVMASQMVQVVSGLEQVVTTVKLRKISSKEEGDRAQVNSRVQTSQKRRSRRVKYHGIFKGYEI